MSGNRSTGLLSVGGLLRPRPLTLPARRPPRLRTDWYRNRDDATPDFERTTVPPPIGTRTSDPLHVGIVADVSPSEAAADPHGYRFVAARRIMDLLRNELADPADRMSVVLFSTLCQPILGPTNPHTKTGRRLLRQVLRPVGGDGGTDIVAGLTAGAHQIPHGWKGETVTFVFTDGQDGSTTTRLHRAIDRYPPGCVHVVSVGPPLPDIWDTLPVGSCTVIASMTTPDHVEWHAAKVLYQALGLEWPDHAPQSPTP